MALFTSFFSLSAGAQEVNDDTGTDDGAKLLIELVSGENRTFELSDKPQLLFSVDKLTVKSERLEADLPLVYSDIQKISFQSGTPTSVDERTNMQEKTVSVRYTDLNTFEVYGIDGESFVAVYSLDGKTMPLDVDHSDNAVVVHLNGYKSGTYIIKIGNQSYKLIKR